MDLKSTIRTEKLETILREQLEKQEKRIEQLEYEITQLKEYLKEKNI
ncbi:MAG: hypothetical protein HeimC3_32050 [Candidatus Heimdallarchaeota archaeon LC_3]|nr:MAG: hypothetical protein HeimC3_32050 [Candidatus Heimdallarchaeota archaeon LC_3]